MLYNRVNLSTFFYVFVWRRVIRAVSSALMLITESEYGQARERIARLLRIKPTPKALHEWYLRNGIEYQSDKVDSIKPIEVFLRDGGGDCDDFAEFASYILGNVGYKCRMLYVRGKDVEAHVVVVASRGKSYFIIDTIACYEVNTLYDACTYFEDEGYTEYLLV